MIELEVSTFVAPVLTALLTAVGVYVAMSNRLSVLETKVDGLTAKVEKHNSVVERTYKLESDMGTAWKRHDELKGRVERLEDAKIGGSE